MTHTKPERATFLLVVGTQRLEASIKPLPGVTLAKAIEQHLAGDEKIVHFGFSPEILSVTEKFTPFSYVDSWVIYGASPPESDVRREMAARLKNALREPSVRYFILEKNLKIDFNWFQTPSEAMLSQMIGSQALKDYGYKMVSEDDHFQLYEKKR